MATNVTPHHLGSVQRNPRSTRVPVEKLPSKLGRSPYRLSFRMTKNDIAVIRKLESEHRLTFPENTNYIGVKRLNLIITLIFASLIIFFALKADLSPTYVFAAFGVFLLLPHILLTVLALLSLVFVYTLLTITLLLEWFSYLMNLMLGYQLYAFHYERAY